MTFSVSLSLYLSSPLALSLSPSIPPLPLISPFLPSFVFIFRFCSPSLSLYSVLFSLYTRMENLKPFLIFFFKLPQQLKSKAGIPKPFPCQEDPQCSPSLYHRTGGDTSILSSPQHLLKPTAYWHTLPLHHWPSLPLFLCAELRRRDAYLTSTPNYPSPITGVSSSVGWSASATTGRLWFKPSRPT